MKNTFIIVCLLAVPAIKAQNYHPEAISHRAGEVYQKAMVLLADESVKEAIPLLQKAITIDSNYLDAFLSLAGAYGELKEYNNAVKYYETVRNKDTAYFKPYNLPYSINLAGLGKFREALEAVTVFSSIPALSDRSIKSAAYRKKCYEFALTYQQQHKNNGYTFMPVNLGDSVNSERSEYYPSLTIDDSLLVFTRRGEGLSENFMESTLHGNSFSKAELINGDINNQPYKGAITVSADGDWMIFAGNFRNGFGNFDLYISYRTPDGWSEPENLGPNVNTEFWESSPALSPDNHVLYFSSNRPGGYGGRDLYMCIRQSNGRWGNAINMGPSINSAGDDAYPYIHADNQTLYYTSDGLPGYGGTDLFITRKNESGDWGVPENLGYPINTVENEGSITISSNGLTAYFASDRSDSRGGLDIYRFTLREDIRPAKTLFVKGRVFDAKTNKGIPCAIELINNSNNKALMKIQVDELGKYFVPLPSGKDYTFTVNRKGYLLYSRLYRLSNKQSDSTYKKDIALQPVELNASFTFKNIRFVVNSYQLLPVSLVELTRLLQFMNDNPTVKIEISGHTDSTGNEANNLTLSASRAKAVANYLVINGIDVKRLSYKGYGSSRPIADNTTEEGRAKNRRTEVVITGV